MFGLTTDMTQEQKDLRAQLDRIMKQDELKWKHRAKFTEILEGEGNTKYLHAKANDRRRKNKMNSLDQEEGKIEGDKFLIEYITNFYKKLFGHPVVSNISLEVEDPKTIPRGAREKLTTAFSLEEIKEVVFKMSHNKSPGPDGFTSKFYQHFWELIKFDLKALIDDFHKGDLDIFRLNYGIITLVPKTKDANQIHKYMPIFMLNVSFKIFTKVLMIRLNGVAGDVISPIQTAFVKGRYNGRSDDFA